MPEPLTIAFNPHFLLDGLSAVESPFVQMAFTTPTKPAVLTGSTSDVPAPASTVFRYLLMPVRLSG